MPTAVEQLQSAYEAAVSVRAVGKTFWVAADEEVSRLAAKLVEARIEATGLRGHILQGKLGQFVASELHWREGYIRGPRLLKNGKLSEGASDRAKIEGAVSLGVYPPPTA